MKKKLLILVSVLLVGTGLLISCKDSLDVSPQSKILSSSRIPAGIPTLDIRTKTPQEQGMIEIYDPGEIPTIGGGPSGPTGSNSFGGGGASIPAGIYAVASYDIKVSSALPPCMKAPVLDVLSKIRNIDSNLDVALTQFSNNNNTLNYAIRTTTSTNMLSIYKQSPTSPAFTGLTTNGDWVTYLNADMLTNSSQEYIASVLIHEIYHIKLYKDGKSDYDNHKYYISQDLITSIKGDLVQLYGSNEFDSNVALGLALGGVTDVDISKYNMTLATVKNFVNSYQTNTKGKTKCSN